jgi:hypothetical protein
VHPVPNEKNKEALEALMTGNLKSFDTWEVELSKAGQGEDAAEMKKEVWINLIKEKKIGYFALLRNLRNILQQAPKIINEALEMLTDEKLIRKSLVLPFRYTTAYDEIQQLSGSSARTVLVALNKAVDISVANVPKFEGETLVVLDESGSMRGKPSQIGSLFAAVLCKANNADLITFANRAAYWNYNPSDSVITITKSIPFNGGGTDFHSIFSTANRKYDRIIILSDMQGWIGYHAPIDEFNKWKRRTGSDPFVYSFDLNSYGSMQFPERNVFCLAGFSEKVFDIMALLEADKQALINKVKEVTF